jgi:hypothetical protein
MTAQQRKVLILALLAIELEGDQKEVISDLREALLNAA